MTSRTAIDDPTPAGNRHLIWLPYVLASLAPLYLMWFILTGTVDVPFADQWALVPLLDRSYRGALTLGDLWAQHNEHRLLFPRLVMLALARLTGWNTHAEMLANIVLAGGIFGVLLAQLRATARGVGVRWRWAPPLLALAVFSLNQAENWWGGWNIQIFLNVLAAAAAIVLLARPGRRWRDLAGALACAFVATYSYGTGLLVWPIGLLLLLARRAGAARPDLLRIAAWLLAGALTIGSFFFHYSTTSQAPAPADLLRHPGPYVTYTLTYLGAPPTRGAAEFVFGALSGDTRAICNLGDSDLCTYVYTCAIGTGALGLGMFVLVAGALARRLGWTVMLPYFGLGLYAICTGCITSLGRASYGNHQALAQRYATGASLFWVALAVLLALAAHIYAARPAMRAACMGMVGLLCALTLLCTLQGSDHFRVQREFLAPAREELFRLHNDQLLQRLYFDPQMVRKDAAILHKYHLSVFR